MCLDPRPDRLARTVSSSRRLQNHPPALHAPVLDPATRASFPAPVVRAPALWALDTLAGNDELVARGWVVFSRDN